MINIMNDNYPVILTPAKKNGKIKSQLYEEEHRATQKANGHNLENKEEVISEIFQNNREWVSERGRERERKRLI